MKITTSIVIFGMLLFLLPGIQSQDLQIVQGNKTKTFKAGHLIKVDLPVKDSMDCKKCQKHSVVGRLISYENQILSLRVRFEGEPIIKNKKDIGTKGIVYKEKMEANWPVVDLSANTILGVTKQGTKKWKPINDGDMLGLTFTAVGLFLLAASTAEDESDKKDAHVQSGIVMTAIGLTMVTIFNRKTYEIENPTNSKVVHKTWNIK